MQLSRGTTQAEVANIGLSTPRSKYVKGGTKWYECSILVQVN